ncbi:AGE family epimerase/isomerase [Priestia endophytica]|uniref:AGE family epimerase/isomerase n=1 Tax=Priestia endophytica TaxID=135735 RepID=UPI000F545539|nr:AGE family epimerase/isomerase [Priestia endophytica]RPK12930.1 D-mannose isomerase [Priestia endophytica]
MNAEQTLHFKDKEYLREQIFNILSFYYPRCIDKKNGGYINGFLRDGTVMDEETKHLVGTSRFIYIFSLGALLDGPEWCKKAAHHGLQFLEDYHRDKENNGYFFELENQEVVDSSKQAYGHAFALLASSIALQAGIPGARDVVNNLFSITEQYFCDSKYGYYMEEWNEDWTKSSSYRGQNANMHMCEALLTAFEATGDEKYINRAYHLARRVTGELAEQTGGMIWEHFKEDWTPDWEYNKMDTKDEFRPYGFVPGHQIEWSKLLLWLDRHKSEPWMLSRSKELFLTAWKRAWDQSFGGMYYSLSPEGTVIDHDKNYWVMAEIIAASALLATKTGEDLFWDYYNEIFSYCNEHFIDHTYGAWYPLLSEQNKPYSEEKSSAPKTDYHPASACYQVMRALSFL